MNNDKVIKKVNWNDMVEVHAWEFECPHCAVYLTVEDLEMNIDAGTLITCDNCGEEIEIGE